MLDFSTKPEERNNDLIPKDTLLWVWITIRYHGGRPYKLSDSGSRYIDMELTVDFNQPYAKRKIWVKVGDPLHAGNSEAYRNMGLVMIRRILEFAFNADPNNAESYKCLQDYAQLDQLKVPVRVTIEKGKNGYEDKNSVEFLSQHSSVKSVVACLKDLQEGKHAPSAKEGKPGATPTPANGSGFGAAPAQAPGGQPNWLANKPAQSAPAPAQAAPDNGGDAPPF